MNWVVAVMIFAPHCIWTAPLVMAYTLGVVLEPGVFHVVADPPWR